MVVVANLKAEGHEPEPKNRQVMTVIKTVDLTVWNVGFAVGANQTRRASHDVCIVDHTRRVTLQEPGQDEQTRLPTEVEESLRRSALQRLCQIMRNVTTVWI